MEVGQEVFGLNGERYIYEGELHGKPLVRELFITTSYYNGETLEETGDILQVEKIYTEPPVKQFDAGICERQNKISELDKKIRELTNEIKSKEEKLEKLNKMSEEDILREKLPIQGLDKVISALQTCLETYCVAGTNIISTRYETVGIKDGKVILLDEQWKEDENCNRVKYYVEVKNDIKHDSKFFTLEEAERCVLNKLKTHNYKTDNMTYEEAIYLDKYFDKYDEERPSQWLEDLIEIKEKEIKRCNQAINSYLRSISRENERIEEFRQKVQEIEGTFKC